MDLKGGLVLVMQPVALIQIIRSRTIEGQASENRFYKYSEDLPFNTLLTALFKQCVFQFLLEISITASEWRGVNKPGTPG